MSEVIFSIVAKNYLPMAFALGESVKKQHPHIDYVIVVADKEDGVLSFQEQRYPIIKAEELGITRLEEMVFKYNITEFCTALKPYAFAYLLERGYNKVIYFDPDIYVFNKLDHIFNLLNDHSMVVTPHYCTMQDNYTGLVPEGMIMHVGIFNLGFCGISNSLNGNKIVKWWKNRLKDQCYGDKIDGLHTDQKWIDFLPSLVNDLYIDRNIGCNVAIWNWHERKISLKNDSFIVENRINGLIEVPLVFYHFSNYNFKAAHDLDSFRPKYIQNFKDMFNVDAYYAKQLVREEIDIYSKKYKYTYNEFDDHTPIIQFQRRIYRRLTETGQVFSNPFETKTKNSFYELLKNSSLLVNDKHNVKVIDKQNEQNYPGFESKLAWIQRMARIAKNMLGIERYSTLCKFLQRFVRPENQTFLISNLVKEVPFYNENRYVNWQDKTSKDEESI